MKCVVSLDAGAVYRRAKDVEAGGGRLGGRAKRRFYAEKDNSRGSAISPGLICRRFCTFNSRMRCANVALLSVALLTEARGASASLQVFPDYGQSAVYENQAFNAEVLVTPSNSYDSSRLGGEVYYTGSGGERINLGSVFGFVAGSASAGVYASATLGGIPKSGTYILTVEGTVEHLGYFNINSPEAVWGRPENFTATSTITVYERPLGDPDAALSNMDNANDGQIGVSNQSYNGEWWNARTIQTRIQQVFTTGAEQAFLERITIRDRDTADAPDYYLRLEGPSVNRLLGRGQKVGKYYTEYVPTDGVLILQPNTEYSIVMAPSVAPPFSATFDATSDRLNERSALGWTAGDTLLVTEDSGGYSFDPWTGGYYIPGSTTITPSSVAPFFSIEATPTGGYDGFPLEGAASRHPFNPADAAKWLAGGSAWTLDRTTSHDGVDSVKAQTTDGQSSWRECTVTGPAVVDFWWKVSSERNYDFFSYSINGAQQEAISGEVDWAYRTLTLPAGTHTVRWTYAKDPSGAIGQDAGWLDDLAVYPAEANLRVRDGATLIAGTTTVDFGSTELQGTSLTKTLTFANEGYVPLEVAISLPEGSAFSFAEGSSYELLLGRGESVEVPISLSTESAGTKSAQLSISAPGSVTLSPTITLQGVVLGQKIGVAQGTTPIAPGQSVSMGLAPRSAQFTVRNTGNIGNLKIASITTTGRFLITQQPHATIAPQGSATFTVLAQTTDFGNQAGSITIASNDPDTPTFTIPLTSRSFAAIPEGLAEGSVSTSGLVGAAGWDLATTLLPSGQTGPAMKTGAAPDNGASILEATLQSAGVISWTWKVSAQEDFDWLLCEVDGQEVAGISTKNGVWQTQVVQVAAGANVRWVYHKDASGSIGEDAGYLADVEFRSFAANESFSLWAQPHGVTNARQKMSKSGTQAMFAWLGGFDPTVGPDADHHRPIMESGLLKYRFPTSKAADGTQQILYSSDMTSWTPRRFRQRIISEDANSMVIEATAPSGTKGFFKVVGSGDTSMVWVEGGTLTQTSELAGTAVATFQIGKTEVTWAEWQAVRDWAVGRGYGDLATVGVGSAGNHPVHSVSWEDAVKWCNAKSEKEGLQPVYFMDGSIYRTGGTFWFGSNVSVDPSANGYRLPREAEWEWAARGGGTSQDYVYSGGGDLNSVGWYWDSSVGAAVDLGWGRGTWPVAQRAANELGLYDMSGNLAEWCWDATADYDTWRRLRGGSWEAPQAECAVFARSGRYASHGYYPAERINRAGFRVARNAED